MKMSIALALAVALTYSNASAQPTTQTTPGYAENITVGQALNVAAGLRQLNKYDAVDKEGKPTTGYYKFSGDIRILIALDLDISSRVEATFSTAKNEMIVEMSNGKSTVPEDKVGQFNIAVAKMLDGPCRCSLYKIKVADMKLEENPVPGPYLSLLIPILDR